MDASTLLLVVALVLAVISVIQERSFAGASALVIAVALLLHRVH